MQYYSAQRIVDEEQWGDFTDALERPLPITFTVTRQFAGGLGLHLQDRLRDGAFPEVHCLDWYPDGSAWKVVTRREEWSPEFKGFLLAATESGLIVRQELVRYGKLKFNPLCALPYRLEQHDSCSNVM